jgi:hypothetical protein
MRGLGVRAALRRPALVHRIERREPRLHTRIALDLGFGEHLGVQTDDPVEQRGAPCAIGARQDPLRAGAPDPRLDRAIAQTVDQRAVDRIIGRDVRPRRARIAYHRICRWLAQIQNQRMAIMRRRELGGRHRQVERRTAGDEPGEPQHAKLEHVCM